MILVADSVGLSATHGAHWWTTQWYRKAFTRVSLWMIDNIVQPDVHVYIIYYILLYWILILSNCMLQTKCTRAADAASWHAGADCITSLQSVQGWAWCWMCKYHSSALAPIVTCLNVYTFLYVLTTCMHLVPVHHGNFSCILPCMVLMSPTCHLSPGWPHDSQSVPQCACCPHWPSRVNCRWQHHNNAHICSS